MDRRAFLKLGGVASVGLALRAGPAKKVVILGAGISGLAAGLELTQAGHDVTILEAQLRPGGRVYTIRAPFSDGLHAEAGAGRIPSTHHLTLDYVKRFQLELDPFFPQAGSNVFLWRGKRQVVPVGQDPDVSQFDVRFTSEERKAGFGGLAKKYLLAPQDQIRSMPDDGWPYLSSPKLSELGKISLRGYLLKQGASADAIQYISEGFEDSSVLDFVHDSVSHAVPMLYKIRGGNDRLPHAMADKLRERIRYGAAAVKIAQNANGVEVIYSNAGSRHTIACDRLICTIPFTVLRGIEVSPEWPTNKGFAIRNLYLGPVARVFAQTKSRFWEADGRNGFAEVDQPMEIWSPTYKEPGTRGIVMSYIYEDLAVKYSAMSEDARIQKSLDLYERIHPGMREHFEGGATWSWLNHPWSKGAYLVTMPGQFQTVLPYVATPEGRIHFAGEHTSPWSGWIQGALHSGLRAAREVSEGRG